ncbi:hypothetical protein AVEN_252237-1 [Araneus ventricosus]|uniref:DUF5641 domain-containing protein n=1 Tax=Araneus ventricosus TaxID=182803 RepID=A0A4Y2R167_ARAVE|nr:hypothetical protein AVEN_252237-1 [Araneus ventricosus]
MDTQPRNLVQLATALESVWLNILVSTFRNLIDSLPARLAAVRSAKVNNLYSEKITSEYLGLLIQRNEHKKQGREIKHGEVVLIGSDNAKYIDWLLGFVIELLPGKDGVARLFRLRTSKGELLRAIQRIFPFEVSSSWFKDCQKETKHENANNEVCNDTAPVIVKIKKWEDCKTTSKT